MTSMTVRPFSHRVAGLAFTNSCSLPLTVLGFLCSLPCIAARAPSHIIRFYGMAAFVLRPMCPIIRLPLRLHVENMKFTDTNRVPASR
jgi:hypothetical protein